MTNSKKGNRYNDEFKKKLYELYQNGATTSELSIKFEIPQGTLYKWFNGLQPIKNNLSGIHTNANELKLMEKRIKELEFENELLKKALLNEKIQQQ